MPLEHIFILRDILFEGINSISEAQFIINVGFLCSKAFEYNIIFTIYICYKILVS
jgi:hypothetical protein